MMDFGIQRRYSLWKSFQQLLHSPPAEHMDYLVVIRRFRPAEINELLKQ